MALHNTYLDNPECKDYNELNYFRSVKDGLKADGKKNYCDVAGSSFNRYLYKIIDF